jgi:hypothetical protein
MIGLLVGAFLMMCGVLSGNIISMKMIDEINRKSEDKMNIIGRTPMRSFKMMERYRNICPNGSLDRYYIVAMAASVAGFSVAAVFFERLR